MLLQELSWRGGEGREERGGRRREMIISVGRRGGGGKGKGKKMEEEEEEGEDKEKIRKRWRKKRWRSQKCSR